MKWGMSGTDVVRGERQVNSACGLVQVVHAIGNWSSLQRTQKT